MNRVDLKVGFACNNRCRFCVQGDKRFEYPDKGVAVLKREMEEARSTCDGIVFTGGEVSIRGDFLELVRHAASLDYSVIQIQTNGRMFASERVCEDVIRAGATEFSPALHGHLPELHDWLTRAPGSFLQTARGIRNLKKLGQTVITNSVVTRPNYRTLPELAALLVNLGVDQYQFAFVHATGTAGQQFETIVPRKSLAEPYIKLGLEVGIRRRVRVMTEAIPLCFMRGYEEYVAERIIPPTRIYEASFVVDDYTRFRLTEGKVKGEPCRRCCREQECEGPWREYPERYGWSEFLPFDDCPPR